MNSVPATVTELELSSFSPVAGDVTAVPDEDAQKFLENPKNSFPFQMLLSQQYRLRFALTCLCWVAVAVGYYGLSFAAGSLSDNVYENMFLFAVADCIGFLVPALLVPVLGSQQQTQLWALSLSGVLLFLCGVLPSHHWSVGACAVLARLSIDVAFSCVYFLVV